ncbi:isoaspartyl peptidase/L-asparaginase [Phenylobacterium sp. VNQ135]|uniref:isoaspartyl peptidase/L-asparaginase n=1 Tax=Phenylobacterium sp. VNQ135 TaxID=3400922 RepID=UPI003C101898
MTLHRPQLILHGGAVADPDWSNPEALAYLAECCELTWGKLLAGESAVRAAQLAVRHLEMSGRFLAGKGAHPNRLGTFELDASIMDGATASGAGVASVTQARAAIDLAERTRCQTTCTLLVGSGVRIAFPDDPAWLDEGEEYFAPLPDYSIAAQKSGLGTVGAAVVDQDGRCAAATATGGVMGKVPGRVGDTAVLGAGTWATEKAAISCTGQGEYFVRVGAAKAVADRLAWLGEDAEEALRHTIDSVSRLGGLGGIIAATPVGVAWASNTAGLKRAWIDNDGVLQAAA